MAVSSRSARQLDSIFQNKLESLGSDLGGDHLAAVRASFQAAKTLSATGGTLAPEQAITADGVGKAVAATGGTFAIDGSSGSVSAFTIGANAYGANGEFALNAANAEMLGLNLDDPSWGKLHGGLAEMFVEAQLSVAGLDGMARDAAFGRFESVVPASLVAAGYVAIDAVGKNADGAALLAQLEALGLVRGAAFGAMAGGFIHVDKLDELARLDSLVYARPVLFETHAGAVQSQNVASMNVDYLHSAYGLTGAGISVGFISDSFNTATLTTQNTALTVHYAQDIASGDLPAGVNILEDGTGTSVRDEGRAMAQLAYDIAPGINVLFHTALPTAANFAQGIIDLYNAGADIIVDDVRYFNEPFFQDGIIAQAVDTVVAGGAMYFSSAGNQGTLSYESVYRPSDQVINITGSPAVAGTYRFHDFDPGAGQDFVQGFTKTGSAAATYILNWDNPSVQTGGLGATADLAIIIFNAAGSPIAAFSSNNVGADAIEVAQNASTTWAGFAIGVREAAGFAVPTYVKTSITGSVTLNEWNTNSGTSFGHSNANGAISVGASDWVDSGRFAAPYVAGESMPYLENFSSRGDVPIFFDVAGNRYASPQWRSNVDFTAGDGGNNTFFGADNPNSGAYAGFEADTSPNFYGTSAAAPNAAAIAALLMAAFPTATREQIERALEQSARDVQVTYTGVQIGDGYDNRAGYGLIQADRAYAILSEYFNDAVLLGAGQAAVIGYNSDDGGTPADTLSFVLLSSLDAGSQIHITDRAWNGTSFAAASAGEGTFTYVAPGNMPAGTIVTLTQAQLSGAGINLSDAGETIYLYQGAVDGPSHFLYAIDIADGNDTFNGNLAGTGLTAGVNAVAVGGDNGHYGDRGHNQQLPGLVSAISDVNNWSDDNSTSQLSPTGNFLNAPDQVIFGAISGDAGLFRAHRDGADVSTLQHAYYQWIDNPATHFNHPNEIVFDTVHGLFFVADSDTGNRRILQGNIADLFNPGATPTLTVLYSDQSAGTSGGQINGLAIDYNHSGTQGALYFVNQTNFNRITYDHDGITASPTSVTLANLGAGQFANEIALDIANNRAWVLSTASSTEPYTVPAGTPGAIFDPDSGTWYLIGTNVTNNQIYTITGLDRTDTGIGQNTVGSLAFSGVHDDPSIGGNTDFNDAYGQIMSIDIDEVNGYLYFVTQQINLGTSGEVGGIYRYNLATGAVQQLYSEGNSTDLGFRYIDVDAATNRYYVSNISFEGAGGEPNGTAVNTSTIMVGTLGAVAAPTVFANTPDMNSAAPWGLTIQNAPTVSANNLAATVNEESLLAGSGLTAGALLFSAVVASDLDTVNGTDELAGAQVRISGNFLSGVTHQDSLRIQGNESGTIAASGINYSYNAATGVLTLSGPGTVAEYQTALSLVTFHTSGDNITNYGQATTRTVSASVFDGLLYSDEVTNTVTVVGINDAPVNAVGGTHAATEDASSVVAGLSVSDPDADPATQDITVTLSVAHGTIAIFTNIGNGIELADVTGNGTATVTITATQNQINTTFAAANGVTYTPSLHWNGADTLTMTSNDNGRTGNDPGNTGTGTSEQDQDTKAITITAVNDAPTVAGDGTEDVATILEDQPSAVGQTVSSLLSGQYSDALDAQFNAGTNPTGSSPGAFSGIAVVANAATAGTGNWEYFNGASWVVIPTTASLSVATVISVGTAIRFNPAPNYNGAVPFLTVRLIDNSGPAIVDGTTVNIAGVNGSGGTTPYSATSVLLSGTITAVNDAPTSTNLSGDTATWTEGGNAVALDVGGNATLADVDSANFDGGTLTVAITAGGVPAQDGLFVDQTGTVTLVGNTVLVGGTQIGTFTGGGFGNTSLVFTLDPDATPAAVQALARAIQYNNNAGDNPTGGARTITWTLVDGDGTANGGVDTLTVTSSVNVLAVNDEPAGADNTVTILEDGSHTFALIDFGFTDTAEGNAFTGVVLTTLPAAGNLLLNGVAITVAGTVVSASDITGGFLTYEPAPNGNGTGYASFTFQVRDDGGVANGGQDTDQTPNSFTFDVTSVNDGPTSTGLAGDAATYTEGSPGIYLDVGNDSTIADLDSANFDGGTLTVAITNVVAAEDQLFIDTSGTVGVAGNAVSVGGTQIATFTGGGAGGAPLVFTFDPDATPAAVQALIRMIAYTNSDLTSPTGGIRNISWTLVDGDGTANGGVDTLTVASTVEVINVNTAPDGTDNTIALLEDGSHTLAAADFGFSDPTEGDAFAGVVITTLPTDGALLLNGNPITVAGTFVSAADISGGLLVFQPSANENGTGYASFTFQVRDDGGTANGGLDTDQSANTLTFDVNAVNDQPTLANLDTNAATWFEGSAPVLLDVGSDAVVGDIDSANFDGGTLIVSITTGAVPAQDVLGIDTSGTVTVAGNAVSVSGVQIATFTGGTNGANLVFTFDPDATPLAVQAVVRAITYSNSGGLSPTPGTRTIVWNLTDGDGTANGGVDAVSVQTSVDVQAINDSPVGTDNTFTINEDGTYVFTEASFGFSDINSDDFAGVVITTVPVPGTLYYDADGPGGGAAVAVSAGAFISAADIALGRLYLEPATDANGTPFTSFTFQVRDDGGTANGGLDTDLSANTLTFNVTAVNDAPILTVPASNVMNEDGSLTIMGAQITVSDVDATTLTVTLSVMHGTLTLINSTGLTFSGGSDGTADATMTFSGTAAAINTAFSNGLTYTPNANFNGADAISINVTDNGETGTGPVGTDSDTILFTITAVNDAPVVVGDGTETAATVTEDTPGAGQTVSSLFSGQYSDAADNQIPNGGASSPGAFSGIAVVANGSSAGVGQWQYFSGGVWTDIGPASMTSAQLISSSTLIRFNPAPDYNGPAPSLTVHLIDNSLGFGIVDGMDANLVASGTGGNTAYSSGTVVLSQADIIAVNDGPVNTVPGTQNINEDGSVTLSTANGNAISVADVDATTLSVTLSVAHGTLTIASTLGLTFSGGSDGTNDATMTFSGTAAAINAALGNGLTYNPTANYNGTDAISVVTTDNGQTGTGGTLTDTDSVSINIASVNDAPQGTDNTVSASEDDPYVFTAADFGFSDPVEGNAFLAVRIMSFPGNGALMFDPDGAGGAAPVNLASVGIGVYVGVADINAGRLYFQPDPDEFGDNYASFLFQVQDNGGTANGGVDTDQSSNTITIDVEPDNLPPVVDLNGAGAGIDYTTAYVEDSAPIGIGAGIVVSDPDTGLGDLIEGAVVTLTDRVAGDSLVFSTPLPLGFSAIFTSNATTITVEISGAGTPAQYQSILSSVVYSTSNQDPTVGGTDTSRTITVTVDDGTIDSATATTTINITAVDDAPVAQPDAFTITESGAIIGANLFASNGSGADSDPDGPPLAISAVNGSGGNVGTQIVLASGALLTVNANGTFDYNPNGAFLPTPTSGSGASNTPGHDSFTYTLTGGNTVTVNITLTGLDTDDTLRGTAGADILSGGLGNDTYYVENGSDQVLEAAAAGNDRVFASVSYALTAGSSVEQLSTTNNAGTGAINLTGNGLANSIIGNAGINTLTGGAGNDLLDGKEGNDTLAGGADNDTLYGREGNDMLYGGTGTNYLEGGSGDDQYVVESSADTVVEAVGGGTDRVYTNVSFVLAMGMSVETLSTLDNAGTTSLNLIGNEQANTIFGNAGANILNGGAGNDLLDGKDGNDTLDGGADNDTLYGGGGNDILYGRTGTNYMAGGQGDDQYVVDNASDTLSELSGQGNDRVYASLSFVLAAGLSVETLSTDYNAGTGAINLTGNEQANLIIGNAGVNVLTGGAGNDVLDGKEGNDTLHGGADNDTLYGREGNDELHGGTGTNYMAGGMGDDVYFVSSGTDTVVESGGQGNDRIFTTVSYSLGAGQEIEFLSAESLASTNAMNLTGNELANTIYGNAGNNVLDGKGGNDLLVGLQGADTFAFTTALGANNVDVVFGFEHAIDKIALDDAIFTAIGGLGALNANAFVTGTAAADASDRIIYNSLTGQLYYDADGTGAGAAIQFATLSPGLALTASDFTVI
ncbi:MAG TPA: Ig-like domain-containing protein [Allosphingosinicella sp.]|nr:Ig-like domain-containing protein [Allosphingosinicella sp.]